MADGAELGKEKQVVLITGCTDGGIGAALALEFLKVGFKVVATSRNVSSMKELSTNENVYPWAMDVTDYEGAKAGVESIIAEHGHIDILVNNAGVPCVAPVAEMPISFLEKTFQANVFGPVVLINAVVPHMVARGKGTIVNVGSIVSLCSSPWGGGYTATKASLEVLTDALRLELRPFGIHAVLIQPGAIESNIGSASLSRIQADVLQNLKIYKDYEPDILERATASQSGKKTPTDEFAKKVVAQVTAKSPPAHFVYGQLSTLFTILYYAPFWFRDLLWRKYYKLDTKRVAQVTAKKDD